ncbi:hypothetical protein TIFTF001_027349 [Ficus carica]|uniref:Uncharacterized protein n=1 Tax=Ficus carica TaxID=3494 RepID=A0AA88DMT4_FICCA|nr:hypothetical protein TIFTF001_027349 [Ficus carica]
MINVYWYELPLQLRMTFKRGLRVQQRKESHVAGLCFCGKSEFNAYPGSDLQILRLNQVDNAGYTFFDLLVKLFSGVVAFLTRDVMFPIAM